MYWIAFYRFCAEIGVIYEPSALDRLDIMHEIGLSCMWWYPRDGLIIACERPLSILMDERSRLHNATGPAVAYRDGWGVYFWHGVMVPKMWIESRNSLTAHAALTEGNMERRRAACEILGWQTVLKDIGAKVIDCDEDPEIGILLEASLPDAPHERFLKVRCGTGRTFVLPVPPTVKTALEANAWTFDIPTNLLTLKEHRT
jgi:hypothetical protein